MPILCGISYLHLPGRYSQSSSAFFPFHSENFCYQKLVYVILAKYLNSVKHLSRFQPFSILVLQSYIKIGGFLCVFLSLIGLHCEETIKNSKLLQRCTNFHIVHTIGNFQYSFLLLLLLFLLCQLDDLITNPTELLFFGKISIQAKQ